MSILLKHPKIKEQLVLKINEKLCKKKQMKIPIENGKHLQTH